MSQPLNLLRIEPREEGSANFTENFCYPGFKCPKCNGTGHFLKRPSYHGSASDEVEVITCRRCNGSGYLCAEVEIRWQPDNS